MFSQGVEHDRESENMASHHEDQEEQLGVPDQLSAKATHQDVPCVTHVMDVRISELELAQHISGIRCDGTEADDKNDCPGMVRDRFYLKPGEGRTHAISPIEAITDGSDRIPNAIISAIIATVVRTIIKTKGIESY